MSEATVSDYIIPDRLFYSFFRNRTAHRLYVPWAGGHGRNIEPFEHFKVLGDPRIMTPQVLGAQTTALCVMNMIRAGVIEFCDSPGQVFDNKLPDGKSMAMFSQDGSPVMETIPLSKDELEARTLPVIVPDCDYDDTENVITIDWLAFAGLDIHDTFVVDILQPIGKTTQIKCGPDRRATFTPKSGSGIYKVTVTLLAVDGRSQAGDPVDVLVD